MYKYRYFSTKWPGNLGLPSCNNMCTENLFQNLQSKFLCKRRGQSVQWGNAWDRAGKTGQSCLCYESSAQPNTPVIRIKGFISLARVMLFKGRDTKKKPTRKSTPCSSKQPETIEQLSLPLILFSLTMCSVSTGASPQPGAMLEGSCERCGIWNWMLGTQVCVRVSLDCTML